MFISYDNYPIDSYQIIETTHGVDSDSFNASRGDGFHSFRALPKFQTETLPFLGLPFDLDPNGRGNRESPAVSATLLPKMPLE